MTVNYKKIVTTTAAIALTIAIGSATTTASATLLPLSDLEMSVSVTDDNAYNFNTTEFRPGTIVAGSFGDEYDYDASFGPQFGPNFIGNWSLSDDSFVRVQPDTEASARMDVNFSFINNTEETLFVTLEFALPWTTAGEARNFINSSSLTYSGPEGEITSFGGNSMWVAQADGADFSSILGAGSGFGFNGSGQATGGLSSQDDFGAIQIDSELRIVINFALTPGAQGGVNGGIIYQPYVIPAPGALLVAGLGLVGFRRRRR